MAKCPVCGKTFKKRDLCAEHIDKLHEERKAETGMDSYQLMYFSTHGTLHGKCMMCGGDTQWNDRTGKPFKLCGKPECNQKMKQLYDHNREAAGMVDQKTLMSDMNHQAEMLKHRRISGQYQFADGGKVDYVAKLELSWLKFCNLIMEMKSWEFQPSPEVFRYYDTKTKRYRQYCPDYYLPDYNLLVEIKDGGDHRNTNPAFLEDTRYKVALKDAVMKKQNKYNYIRISGTTYGPFVETLFKIVHDDYGNPKTKTQNLVVINETAGIDPVEEIEINPYQADANTNHITLMIGYMLDTSIPSYYAITDSRYLASWYVSDISENYLYQADPSAPIFRQGSYKMYHYIGDMKSMQTAFARIVASSVNKIANQEWSIIQILADSNIWFDDGKELRNNNERKMDFIFTGGSYTPYSPEEGDDE